MSDMSDMSGDPVSSAVDPWRGPVTARLRAPQRWCKAQTGHPKRRYQWQQR